MLRNSCTVSQLGLLAFISLVGCKSGEISDLHCDTVKVVVYQREMFNPATGVQWTEQSPKPDTGLFLGPWIRWAGTFEFARDMVFLKVRRKGQVDTLWPSDFAIDLSSHQKGIPAELEPIQRCLDSVRARFPSVH